MARIQLLPVLLAASLMASCAEQKPQTPAQLQRAEAIHKYVMSQVPAYAEHSDAKAMAACIRWPGGKEKRDKAVSTRRFITGINSDFAFSANQLMNSAMNLFEQEVEGAYGCSCHRLVQYASNELRVPE